MINFIFEVMEGVGFALKFLLMIFITMGIVSACFFGIAVVLEGLL